MTLSPESASPKPSVAPASGKLGVLMPGLGAVASTFIAGVLAARSGIKPPIGSVSQMAFLDDGPGGGGRRIKEAVPLATLDDLVFGGWDPISANGLDAAPYGQRVVGIRSECRVR